MRNRITSSRSGSSPGNPPPGGDQAASILAVDFGNTHTRAVLAELVDGVYALVARADEPTTGGFPAGDVSIGLGRVLRQIGAATGRRLMSGDGRVITPEQADRSGVDVFVATASIGRPLRTILIGLVPGISVISGQRAAAGTYIDIVDMISLDDTRSEEGRLNAIVRARPDLIFIVGGTEDGAHDSLIELVEIAQTAVRVLPGGARPLVLFAGNSAAAAEVAAGFGDLVTVLTADNVRPTLETEALPAAQLQLARAFDSVAGARDSAFEQIGSMTQLGVLPNAQSYALIVNFLGQSKPGSNFLAFDIGSATSTLSASVEGHTATSIRTDLGLGHSAADLLAIVGTNAVRRWLPFPAPDDEIIAYALNKTVRPAAVPEGLRMLYLEHAFVRAALTALLATSRPTWTPTQAQDDPTAPLPPFERVIGAGAAISGTGRPGLAALLMLDALQPHGVTRLQTDSAALLPALGALARLHPDAVVQLLDAQGLDEIGTVINLGGQPRPGQPAATVTLTLADGRQETHRVEGGQLWIYPLGVGVRATVTVRAGRGSHIGGKRRMRFEAEGGQAGLIVDGRGRPLPLAADLRVRAEQLAGWYAQATGDPVRAIDADWLAAENLNAALAGQKSAEAEILSVTDQRMKNDRKAEQSPRRGKRAATEATPSPGADALIAEGLTNEPNDPPMRPAVRGRGRRPEPTPASPASKGENVDDLRNLLP